jgi:peptidoglycan lytic transglycosylase G
LVRRLALALTLLAVAPAHATPSPRLHIVFPEGQSVRQMVDRVAAVRRIAIAKRELTPALTGTKYAAAAKRARPPAGFGAHSSIEGFLFPDTYAFGPATRAVELVALQQAAFTRAWKKVRVPAGRSSYDVLIVASMVERETVAPEERALVSAVIWNRLAKGMPLGIDATLRYGLGIPGTRPITAKAQRSRSPYNTNRFTGLPPTPIGNPGLASMRAAAHPAHVDYLYYVRLPDKLHHFFTASEAEFCAKAVELGYKGC